MRPMENTLCTDSRGQFEMITRPLHMLGMYAFMTGAEARFPLEPSLHSATIQRAPPA